MKKKKLPMNKHVPMRMCAVTFEKLPKNKLLRFVFLKNENKVVLDEGERLRGRGLNIKPELSVFEKALKTNIFERSFNIKLRDEDIKLLRNIVKESINKRFSEKIVIRITKDKLDSLKK